MKKILISVILACLIMTGCEVENMDKNTNKQETNETQIEKPVEKEEIIDVDVIENDKREEYCKCRYYYQYIKVKSQQYNIEKYFEFQSSGMFASMPFWNVEKDDKLKCKAIIYYIESTGEIVEVELFELIKE